MKTCKFIRALASRDKRVKDLNTNLIYKTINNLENNLKIKILAKYFNREKFHHQKVFYVNFPKKQIY